MSLINDALKKAQEKRAQEAAAQTPPAPPPRPPAPDTISQPHPDDVKRKIPAPPPPPDRPQLPIPPLKPTGGPGPRRVPLPPIVNYSIPQIDPAEQPATPNQTRPRVSSIRYNPSGDDETESGRPRSSAQKTFWIALGCIAAVAIVVRLVVTMGRNDSVSSKPQVEQVAPLQVAVAVPTPSLPPPTPPVAPTREIPPVTTPEPEKAEPPASAVAAAEPPPTISFPTKPAATAKSTPAPAPAPATKPAATATAPVVSLPPDSTPPAASAPAPAQPAPAALPPIYAPRAPAPVNNATRIQNFIDRLRVTSVRISDKGSKVILNDRLFNVGDMVDPGLELKLVKIEPGVITFTEPGGKKFIKLYQ
ncbi:MAG: hypothetical protein QM715_18890 [Nibricoccus sp.]